MEAGSGFKRFLELVNVTVAKLELKLTQPIATSPTGSVSADTASFKAGDTVTFRVKLDAAKLNFPVIGYNIESVRIYRKTADSLVLAEEVNASAGQSEFELPWVATVDGEVANNFVAFVKTKLMPDLRLELGDATAPQPGGATLTFTETHEGHLADSGTNFEEADDYSGIMEGSYQLRKVSETSGKISFKIVGGSLSETYEEHDHEVDRNVDGSSGGHTCIYNETIDDRTSTSGSVTPQGTVSVSFDPDNTYVIDATEQVWVMSGPYTYTERYAFIEGGPCITDVTDSGQDSYEDSYAFEEDGTVDSNNPKVLSDSYTEPDGDGGTFTFTYTLTME